MPYGYTCEEIEKMFKEVDVCDAPYEPFYGIDKGKPSSSMYTCGTNPMINRIGETIVHEPVSGSVSAFIPGVSYVATGVN